MKLVVFAHTPPPFHGQSYMVKLMLEGLQQADSNVRVFYVYTKLSSILEAFVKFRLGTFFCFLLFCLQASFLRFVNGGDFFSSVPSRVLRAPFYRNWIVIFFSRPFFK